MGIEYYFALAWLVRNLSFAPLDPSSSVIFGFGEYLTGLALMVLAWTTADARYRFRISTAPVPMVRLTFWVVAAVGALILVSELWRAEAWPFLVGPISPAMWQAMLGGALLVTFLGWAWFAFIQPPTYGRLNARRYAEALYRAIVKGNPEELAVVADELARSAAYIVHNASEGRRGEPTQQEPPRITGYANAILLLIADQRFCRAVVGSSPNLIGALFQALRKTKKYEIPIESFSRNVVRQAIANRDSFLYHESSGYESGLLGYEKPLTSLMFSDFSVVEGIGTLLDPGYFEAKEWRADQWGAYSRTVLTALQAFAKRGFWWGHGHPFHSALELFKHAVSELHRLNGSSSLSWDDEIFARLRVVTDFIKEAFRILDGAGVPKGLALRVRDRFGSSGTFYDDLAEFIAEVVFAASAVTSPRGLCWTIQHNSVWAELTWFHNSESKTIRAVLFKLRRILYNDIVEMSHFPNFKGAGIFCFCFNVMGFNVDRAEQVSREMQPLHKSVLAWTKANYAKLRRANPRVAERCLVDGITYDEQNHRLVKTYPAEGLSLEPHYEYLDVDP